MEDPEFRERVKAHRAKCLTPERRAEYNRRRMRKQKTPEGRAKHAAQWADYLRRHPEYKTYREEQARQYYEEHKEEIMQKTNERNRRNSSKENLELFGYDSEEYRGLLRKMSSKRRAEVILEELSAKNREEALRSGLLPEDFIFDV